MFQIFSAGYIENCVSGAGDHCLTNVPRVEAGQESLTTVLNLVFGIIAAVVVIILVIQGVKFSTSQGDPQKIADARRAIIYALVGLVVALSADAVVNFVIGRI